MMLPVVLLIIVGVLVVVGLNFGSILYYRFAGNAIHRIASRASLYEERYLKESNDRKELYLFIKDSRKIIELLEETNPSHYLLPYYTALFDFYEFQLRLELDGESLAALIGRGYLPVDRGIAGLEEEEKELLPLEKLSHNITYKLRRSLAINPDMPERDRAQLMIVYTTIFDTGRTDPYLLETLDEFRQAQFNPLFQPMNDWISVALYSILGRSEQLQTVIEELPVQRSQTESKNGSFSDTPGSLTNQEAQSYRLELTQNQADYILAYGHLYAEEYIRALTLIRSVLRQKDLNQKMLVSGVMLEGEIFLAQRGPIPALRYFRRALQLAGGNDPVIEQRIKQVEERLSQR